MDISVIKWIVIIGYGCVDNNGT